MSVIPQSLPPPPPPPSTPPYNDSNLTKTANGNHQEAVSLLQKSCTTANNDSTYNYSSVWSKWQRLAVLIFLGCAATFLWDGVELSQVQDASNTAAKNATTTTTVSIRSGGSSSLSTSTTDSSLSLAPKEEEEEEEPPLIQVDEAEPEAVMSDGQDLDHVMTTGSSDMDMDEESTADQPQIQSTPATNPPLTTNPPKITTSNTENDNPNENKCQETCTSSSTTTKWNDMERFHGNDLTHAKTLQQVWQDQRKLWITRLEQDYGKAVFQAVFFPKGTSVGREGIFTDPARIKDKRGRHPVGQYTGVAWNRMMRKHQLKILQVQLAMLQERQQTCAQTCDTTTTLPKPQQSSNDYYYYATWTWVTAGHSASAGHGNFYREAYTGVMQRDLQPLFATIGVNWQAKNYAMGGTTSAEEMALCFHSVYGKDADFVSWDFGMTDGGVYWKPALFALKAARLSRLPIHDSDNDNNNAGEYFNPHNIPHRPAVFWIHPKPDHGALFNDLQEAGLTTLVFDSPNVEKNMLDALPDMMGKTDDEIASFGPYVRYFKCEGKIEKGDPGCGEHKFNHSMCDVRRGRTSWHPGYKYHALEGHMIAITLIESFSDAIEKLVELESSAGPQETLSQRYERLLSQFQQLNAEEEADYNRIFQNPLPPALHYAFEELWEPDVSKGKNTTIGMKFLPFAIDPSFCHTAYLPAEIRFKGLLTESDLTGDVYNQIYEQGYPASNVTDLQKPTKDTLDESSAYVDPRPGHADQLTLVTNNDDHENCPEPTNKDFKDAWQISTLEGWRSLTLPNDAEAKYYNEFDAKRSHGWVLVCLRKCSWGKCARDDLSEYFLGGWPRDKKSKPAPTKKERAPYGYVEMEINGVVVTEGVEIEQCRVLKHKDSDPTQAYVWKPNDSGKYDIRVRIHNATRSSHLGITSFIFL